MSVQRRQPTIVPIGEPLPPPRPGVRHVRLPRFGVIIADDRLRRRVARRFHWPMIVLAAAMVPFLIIEFTRSPEGWLRWVLSIGFVIVWTAFLIEFVVKIAIAERRIEYVRRNWLDVVILVVPVLRPLRITALGRTARVFKLRGVAMKGARSVFTLVVGLEATDRVLERIGLGKKKDRLDPAEMTRHQLMAEVGRLRRNTDAWEAWYDAHDEFVTETGGRRLDPPGMTEPEIDGGEPPTGLGEADVVV